MIFLLSVAKLPNIGCQLIAMFHPTLDVSWSRCSTQHWLSADRDVSLLISWHPMLGGTSRSSGIQCWVEHRDQLVSNVGWYIEISWHPMLAGTSRSADRHPMFCRASRSGGIQCWVEHRDQLASLYPDCPHRQGGCISCCGCTFESRWGCTDLNYAQGTQGVLPMMAGGVRPVN